MLVKPAVIIGVGSSGAEILRHLQELIYEEYLVPEFPVVQLVAIVSDERDFGQVRQLPAENKLRIAVPTMNVVTARLATPSDDYTRALRRWLPEQLYSVPGFQSGSENNRAVGRLHFWENYDDIMRTVRAAHTRATSGSSRDTVNRILHRRLTGGDGYPAESYVGQGCRTYILGTLAGGTCSGMVADLGYSLPREGLPGATGIFTILASDQAAHRKLYSIWAANCWAALNELNYHYRDNRTDPIYHPAGKDIGDKELPYERLYILGPKNMYGDALQKGNDYDYDGLLQVIALGLFLDVCAGTGEARDAMHADYRAMIATPLERDRHGNRPRAFSSFGAASISYPKYRVAAAAACHLAQDVVSKWLSPTYAADAVKKAAEATCKEVTSTVFRELALRPSEPSLDEAVHKVVMANQWILDRSAVEIRRALNTFPGADKDPLASRFTDGGTFRTRVESQYNTVVVDLVRNRLAADYYSLRTKDRATIPALQDYLTQVRQLLERRKLVVEGRPQPEIKLAGLESGLRKLEMLENDTWLAALLLKRRALRERKQALLKKYEGLVNEAVGNLLAQYETKLLTLAIDTVDEQIAELGKVEKTLRVCCDWGQGERPVGKLQDHLSELMEMLKSPPTNTRYVFARPTPEEDVQFYRSKVSPDQAEVALRQMLSGEQVWNARAVAGFDARLAAVTDQAVGDLVQDLITPLLMRIMQGMERVNAREVATEQWDAAFEGLVNYAYPYIELTGLYLGMYRLMPAGGRSRKSVFALGTRSQIEAEIVNKIPNGRGRDDQAPWYVYPQEYLDHHVVFYCEEPHFTTSFLTAADLFKDHYTEQVNVQGGGQVPLRIYWSDKRWIPRHGPPYDEIDRAENLGFLIEHAYDFFCKQPSEAGDPVSGDALFTYRDPEARQQPIYEYESSERSMSLRIDVGVEDSYRQAARDREAAEVLDQLDTKVIDLARQLGQDEFRKRGDYRAKSLEDERVSGKKGVRAWTDADETQYQRDTKRLTAFVAYVRRRAWGAELLDQDLDAVRNYPWLRV